MNHTSLMFTFLLSIAIPLAAILTSNATIYAQQLSSSLPASKVPQQQIPKVKITSPTKGQQIPVGKDLTISGTSIGNNNNSASSNCHVSVTVNKVKPYQPTNPTGAAGAGSSSGTDYSKWNYILTSKYTTIKPGANRITAKYECANNNNPTLTAFSSVNVTGVPTSTTMMTRQVSSQASSSQTATSSVTAPNQQQQVERQQKIVNTNNNDVSKSNDTAKVATVSQNMNPSSKPLSSTSSSAIAPQVNTMNQQSVATTNTAGEQNNTVESSPIVSQGKVIYLGYHGNSTGTTSANKLTDKSPTSSKSPSQNDGDKNHTSHGSNAGEKSSSKGHSNHKKGDSFFGHDSFFSGD